MLWLVLYLMRGQCYFIYKHKFTGERETAAFGHAFHAGLWPKTQHCTLHPLPEQVYYAGSGFNEFGSGQNVTDPDPDKDPVKMLRIQTQIRIQSKCYGSRPR